MLNYTRTDTTLLNIDHVSLSFGDRLILRDVHVKVQDVERPDCAQGQVICFLGPSGIGKTQLSRIIAGLQKPTEGHVSIQQGIGVTGEGVKYALRPTAPGCVGMVPQSYPLFDFATVSDNLHIAGRQGGLTALEAREKAAGYIDAFGLRDHLKMYPAQLSGGTRQRVAIARQLMCAKNYLVMDEPFSGLDPIMKKKASELITKLATLDSWNTIIIVTHDITEGLSVADTVWLMGYEPNDGNNSYPQSMKFLPGARVVKEYDLAAMDLCWHSDINSDPRFLAFVAEVKARFQTLR